MREFTTLWFSKALLFSVLFLFACGSKEEVEVAPISTAAEVLSIKLSVDGTTYDTDVTPYLKQGLHHFLRTKTPLPYGTEEVVIEEVQVSAKASTTLKKGEIKEVNPDKGIDFTITAENGLEITYTLNPTFDFPDFNVENFEVVPTPTSSSNNFKTIMLFQPYFTTEDITGVCFKSNVWGTYGYDGWGLWDEDTNFDPRKIDANGRREIQHLIYPLIDLYDVNDPIYQEHFALTLKTSGVDIVAYTLDLRDRLAGYEENQCDLTTHSSEAYFSAFEEVGLPYILRISASAPFSRFGLDKPTEEEVTTAYNDLVDYLQQNYFNRPNYFHQNGLPVIVITGGVEEEFVDNYEVLSGKMQVIANGVEFFDNLPISNKALIGQPCEGDASNCVGSPEISLSNNIESVSDILYDEGIHLKENLNRAKENGNGFIYLDTWNNYFTHIRLNLFEPTREFGHSQLSVLSEFLGAGYGEAEFKVCTDYYIKRKAFPNDELVQLKLDQIKQYILSNQMDKAIELNATIE